MLKRYFLFLYVIVRSCICDAQIHVGIFGGMNYSNVSIKNFSFSVAEPPFGYTISSRNSRIYYRNSMQMGIKLEIDIANNLLVSIKTMIQSSGFHENFKQHYFSSTDKVITDSIGGKDVVRLLYSSTPVHLEFSAPLGKAKLKVGAGFFMAFGLTGHNDFKMSYSTFPGLADSILPVTFSSHAKYKSNYFHANRFDFGPSISSGVQFRNGFFLELIMESGIMNVFKDRFIIKDMNGEIVFSMPDKRRILSLSVGYKFKKKYEN